MIIKSAKFLISNTDIGKCPQDGLPEYAFIGRSNVGKSSLINMLTGIKGLAITSSKPGKTQLINHFLINEGWYLVDLPGYGYARKGKEWKKGIAKIISDYINLRASLTNLFILIDSRLEPQKIDLDFIQYTGECGIPSSIIFTKIDKVSNAELSRNIKKFSDTLSETWEVLPPFFYSSSEKKQGKEEILKYIDEINKSLNEPRRK